MTEYNCFFCKRISFTETKGRWIGFSADNLGAALNHIFELQDGSDCAYDFAIVFEDHDTFVCEVRF